MATRSADCAEPLFRTRRHLGWWLLVAEYWVLMKPHDGCMLCAAFLARCIFVPRLDASLESEVLHPLSPISCTSRREAGKKKGRWAQMNINPVVIELHCDDFLQVTNEHPTCSTLFPFCAPSSVSVLFFLVCFSLLRFGIVPGRVRTHPEDRQCWFLVYSLFSCSPLLYLFADALVSGSRPKSTFFFLSLNGEPFEWDIERFEHSRHYQSCIPVFTTTSLAMRSQMWRPSFVQQACFFDNLKKKICEE